MAVKVLISRRYQNGKAMELLKLLNKLRVEAMNQPGYITGETLIGHDDPQKLMVVGTWDSVDHWLKWQDDRNRADLEARIGELLTEPPTVEVFTLGTFPFRK